MAPMEKSTHESLNYLKFLNLVQAIRKLPSFPEMDAVEERLLNMLAVSWHVGKKITVLEAMAMLTDISATTAHRRLKTLRKKGMIALIADEADNRIKYVTSTPTAMKYFAKLSECIDKSHSA